MRGDVDFLGEQPPFDQLDAGELVDLAAQIEVEHVPAGTVVATGDEPLADHWIVRTGSLELLDGDQVVDLLGPGDRLGRGADLPPGVRARAAEASTCLRVPGQLMPNAALSLPRPRRPVAHLDLTTVIRSLRDVMRPIVWCESGDRIGDVARRIGATDQSCALVRGPAGLGIVTDHDFRQRVVAGPLSSDQPVVLAATSPALTIDAEATQMAALLRMVEHGVHHLVVTDADEPVGIVRVVDLAPIELRDPLLIRAEIETASNLDRLTETARRLPSTLVELWGADAPAAHVGAIQAAMTDAVVRRAVALRAGDAPPGATIAWVVLGSLARREPLPRSDLDTALIWADTPGAEDAADSIRTFARAVLTDLAACGLLPCPNGANADNPLFSRSQSGWASAARGWRDDPSRDGALLLSAMVADSRPLTGLTLGLRLTESIRSHTRTTQFLRALLDEALAWRPPTGFVRDFVVEHSGQHRGQLDLKRGGLMPVVALARWIAIVTNEPRGTTPERIRRGGAAGLLTADETDTLINAFAEIYSLLLQHELTAVRSGIEPQTFLNPRELDSLTRRYLRESFRVIAQVQQRVDLDWIRRLTG